MEVKPKEHGMGSGKLAVYVVEARLNYSEPREHCGMMLDKEWRQVEFPSAPIGIPVTMYCALAKEKGFLNYEAALALAYWFMAERDSRFLFTTAFCVQTRIVQVKFSYSYSTEEVGVGPALSASEAEHTTKFEPRQ